MVKYIPHNQKLAKSASFQNALKKLKNGRTDEEYREYLKNKRAPTSPYQQALNALNSGDHGDRAYEEEQLSYQFQNNDALKKQMSDYYENNPNHFTSDGSRVHREQADVDAYIRMSRTGQVKPYTAAAIRKMEGWGLDLSAMKPSVKKAPAVTEVIPVEEKTPAYQEYLDGLPQMMAPPPGERHMLFALKNRPKYLSSRDNYLNSAFDISPEQKQMPAKQEHPGFDFYGAMAANAAPVQMPYSNVERYNAYQLGAPRTPYDELINHRSAEIQKLMGVRAPQITPNQIHSVFNRFNPSFSTQNYAPMNSSQFNYLKG